MSRKLVLGLFIIAAVIAVWLRQKQYGSSSPPPTKSSTETEARLPAAVTEAQEGTTEVTSANPAVSPPPADPEFQKWLSAEAQQMDHAHIDGEAKRVELRKAIARWTATQTRQLLLTARSPNAPSGEKILSTYLLVESGPLGRAQLAELIQAPLPDRGPRVPHSEGEMKGIRDKSLRIMGIDGLFAQAKNDQRARETLARVVPGIEDPFLRSYAEEKLRQLR